MSATKRPLGWHNASEYLKALPKLLLPGGLLSQPRREVWLLVTKGACGQDLRLRGFRLSTSMTVSASHPPAGRTSRGADEQEGRDGDAGDAGRFRHSTARGSEGLRKGFRSVNFNCLHHFRPTLEKISSRVPHLSWWEKFFQLGKRTVFTMT